MDSRLRRNDARSRTAGMTTGGVALNERDLACKQLREWCPMDVLDFPLSRLCYAAHSEDAAEVGRAGLEAWLGQQLDSKNTSSPDLRGVCAPSSCRSNIRRETVRQPPTAIRAIGRPWTRCARSAMPARPIDSAWALLDPKIVRPNKEYLRPYHEVAAATIIRAVHSRAQLYERMVGFWHDHFNVLGSDDRGFAGAASYDRDAIRPPRARQFPRTARGRRDEPGHARYISRTELARRRRQRELWPRASGAAHARSRRLSQRPLRPLARGAGRAQGRAEGYIDEDVYEAARAFTGWTVENGPRHRRGKQAARGRAASSMWNPGTTATRNACWQRAAAVRAPMADGRKVLDLAAFHPATARFLCLKLCRCFVGDTPPQSLVDSAAKVWIDNAKKPDQIAAVVKHIALSKEFAASRGAKPKSPLALAASFARVTGIELTPTMPLINQLSQCGQRLFGWPTPDGRPTSAEYYLTPEYLRERWVLLAKLAANAWNNGQPKALLAANGEPQSAATRLRAG